MTLKATSCALPIKLNNGWKNVDFCSMSANCLDLYKLRFNHQSIFSEETKNLKKVHILFLCYT